MAAEDNTCCYAFFLNCVDRHGKGMKVHIDAIVDLENHCLINVFTRGHLADGSTVATQMGLTRGSPMVASEEMIDIVRSLQISDFKLATDGGFVINSSETGRSYFFVKGEPKIDVTMQKLTISFEATLAQD